MLDHIYQPYHTYHHFYIPHPSNDCRELAYSQLLTVIRTKTARGMVPNFLRVTTHVVNSQLMLLTPALAGERGILRSHRAYYRRQGAARDVREVQRPVGR
jgi:hypothetical protein